MRDSLVTSGVGHNAAHIDKFNILPTYIENMKHFTYIQYMVCFLLFQVTLRMCTNQTDCPTMCMVMGNMLLK